MIQSDDALLSRVLGNLIKNALEGPDRSSILREFRNTGFLGSQPISHAGRHSTANLSAFLQHQRGIGARNRNLQRQAADRALSKEWLPSNSSAANGTTFTVTIFPHQPGDAPGNDAATNSAPKPNSGEPAGRKRQLLSRRRLGLRHQPQASAPVAPGAQGFACSKCWRRPATSFALTLNLRLGLRVVPAVWGDDAAGRHTGAGSARASTPSCWVRSATREFRTTSRSGDCCCLSGSSSTST